MRTQSGHFNWKIAIALALALPASLQEVCAISLPYDNTCPVIYDNDDHDDMYTDEYLLSLAGAGSITFKGKITTSGGWVESLFPDPVFSFQWELSGRSEIVGKALRSGMINAPVSVAGASASLIKPASGNIEDTVPIDTPGSRLIVNEAQNATVNKPLVIIMGGPPTTLASAYLLDNSIANRIVLAWVSGGTFDGTGENQMQNFNDAVDPWAMQIIVRRFRTYLFGLVFWNYSPLVSKASLTNLPNTELRQWMIDKELPHVQLPGGADHDGAPAITLMRPDYIITAKTKSFDHADGSGNVFLKDDANGSVFMVTQVNQSIGTVEWWRALTNSAAYGGSAPVPVKSPFGVAPANIPGTIQAENFDYGGPEIAYHDLDVKTMDDNTNRSITTFRVTDRVDFDLATGDAGGYALAVTRTNEWTAYTVNVSQSGQYTIDVRVASKGVGGSFHVEFNGANVTGPLNVPDTGDWQNWQTITKSNVTLTAGQQTMRIVMDTGGISNLVGDINYVRIWPAGQNGPNDDPDGDGLSNAQEDLLGSDPLDGASRGGMQITARGDGTIQLSHLSLTNRLYTIEYLDGLNNTNWQAVGNYQSVAGVSGLTNYIDDGTGTGSSPATLTNRFYRLRATWSP
jgi:hypothetical protein